MAMITHMGSIAWSLPRMAKNRVVPYCRDASACKRAVCMAVRAERHAEAGGKTSCSPFSHTTRAQQALVDTWDFKRDCSAHHKCLTMTASAVFMGRSAITLFSMMDLIKQDVTDPMNSQHQKRARPPAQGKEGHALDVGPWQMLWLGPISNQQQQGPRYQNRQQGRAEAERHALARGGRLMSVAPLTGFASGPVAVGALQGWGGESLEAHHQQSPVSC